VVLGVAGRVQRLQADAAGPQRDALGEADIGASEAIRRRIGDPAARLALELQRRGDVVGMDVRVHGVGEPEAARGDLGKVALPRRHHRIDEDREPGLLAAQQVGVRARDGLEELREDHARG
jgi:hypothetical protein